MNLIELMLSVSLLSIVISGLTHTVPVLQAKIYEARIIREEIAQVDQVIQIINRSIRQAGFVNLLDNNSVKKTPSNKGFKGIQVFSQSILTTHAGDQLFAQQNNLVGNRKTDAIIIRHELLGHFDCLGRKITPARTQAGLARIGFFVQLRGSKNQVNGVLMCQTLNNKGQAQNEGILSGVQDFKVVLTQVTVQIELTMQSKRHYKFLIARKNV